MSFETFVERSTMIARHPGWRISFGRVFHRNGTAKENERFPV